MTEKSAPKFGATGEFPEGKLRPDDEGELVMGVAVDQGHVIVNFGKPTAWIGLPPGHARRLAKMLTDAADKC